MAWVLVKGSLWSPITVKVRPWVRGWGRMGREGSYQTCALLVKQNIPEENEPGEVPKYQRWKQMSNLLKVLWAKRLKEQPEVNSFAPAKELKASKERQIKAQALLCSAHPSYPRSPTPFSGHTLRAGPRARQKSLAGSGATVALWGKELVLWFVLPRSNMNSCFLLFQNIFQYLYSLLS